MGRKKILFLFMGLAVSLNAGPKVTQFTSISLAPVSSYVDDKTIAFIGVNALLSDDSPCQNGKMFEVFSRLKKTVKAVHGLSYGSGGEMDDVAAHLQSKRFNFSPSWFLYDGQAFQVKERDVVPQFNQYAVYAYGVIFTGAQGYQNTLSGYLRRAPLKPNKILLVDDRRDLLVKIKKDLESIPEIAEIVLYHFDRDE